MEEAARKRELDERRIREDQAKRDHEDAQREKEREAKRDEAERKHIEAMERELKTDPAETADAGKRLHGTEGEGHRSQKRDALDRVLGTKQGAADGTDGKSAELRPGQSGYLGSQPGQRDGGDGVIRDENNNVISPAVGGDAGNAATAAPDGRTSPPAQNVTPPVGGPEKSGADAISSAQGFNAIGGGDPDNGNPQPAENEEVPPQTKPHGKVGDKPKGKHK